jgi:methyltransferase (TIGR00027 family)
MTANIVSVARGIGISRTQRDCAAVSFASGWVAHVIRVFERESTLVNVARFAVRALTFGVVDHNTVRMLVIDEYIRSGLRAGCKQVVILGAGLDARGWRMPELDGVTVFELDQPSTLRTKAARAAELGSPRAKLCFVPNDLKNPDFAQPLFQAGYRRHVPAVWVCEGVTPYLDADSIARLWCDAAAVSSLGSKFVVSYITPAKGVIEAIGRRLVQRVVSRLGEPAPGAVTQADMQRFVTFAGLRQLEDIDWEGWVTRVANYFPLPNLFRERLSVAEKANDT